MALLQPRAVASALHLLSLLAPARAGRILYDRFCTPPARATRTATEVRAFATLAATLASAEHARIATPDATAQTYLWRSTALPHRGRILLVHGWTAEAAIMALFVEPLRRAGFDVVAIDLPGHGKAAGARLSMAIGARALLATGDTLGPFTAVIGHSFGGLAAALAAEGGSPLSRRLPLERIVLISTPHSVARLAQTYARDACYSARLAGLLKDAIASTAARPLNAVTAGALLSAAAIPALVIHDDDDAVIPASEAAAIVAASGATLVATKGLGHDRIIVMPVTVRASVRFLKGDTP